eukprot:TRINITY_DN775_c0_g8_i1.p1 TRINITY_DN775_c0_g8~~TRINITY_DN775_c0_g8_i1.p1  ORF type:complete len:956 (-),score=249.19 TRINITY_DN775_c0_g8_i1:43-2514(-)
MAFMNETRRFRDNNELIYSIRSIEHFAPWIRNIYLVTNGQIPSWIDLDHPRIRLVTHEEIFPDSSVLPVYSSPAIEANLHNIKGLSERFLYFNDDVMLGAEVWPEDFYSTGFGQKIYYSWDAPQCSDGCSDMWLGDGFCDQACNNTVCNFDFGDCSGGAGTHPPIGGAAGGGGYSYRTPTAMTYCTQGCPSSWLGDGVCDFGCNKPECGFDAADCGYKGVFDELAGVTVDGGVNGESLRSPKLNNTQGVFTMTRVNATNYEVLTEGDVSSLYWNITDEIVPEGCDAVESISHDYEPMVSKLVYNTPLKTILMVFTHVNQEETDLSDGLKMLCAWTDVILKYKLDEETGCNGPSIHFNVTRHDTLCDMANSNSSSDSDSDSGSQSSSSSSNSFMSSSESSQDSNSNSNSERSSEDEEDSSNHDSSRRRILQRIAPIIENPITMRRHLQEEPEPTLDIADTTNVDTYSKSLSFVNMLYHHRFGVSSRRVPAHMPHLITKSVMTNLQEAFPKEFNDTWTRRFRHVDDMQFAFAYMHFLMLQEDPFDVEAYFHKELDTDHTGDLSMNEVETLIQIVNSEPASEEQAEAILDCLNAPIVEISSSSSSSSSSSASSSSSSSFSSAAQHTSLSHEGSSSNSSDSPTINNSNASDNNDSSSSSSLQDQRRYPVTLEMIQNCESVMKGLAKNVSKPKRYHVMPEEDVAFEMIGDDYKDTKHHLDSVRARKPKFICINDDMRNPTDEVAALLENFYKAFFPIPSQFELPPNKRNKYLNIFDIPPEQYWFRAAEKISIFTAVVSGLMLVVLFIHNKVLKNKIPLQDQKEPEKMN